MATRRPSLFDRALSTPPTTPIAITPGSGRPELSKPSSDIHTPPLSPIRSRSSSNLFQTCATFPFDPRHQTVHRDPCTLPKLPNDDVLICPFDIEVLHDHRGQFQVFGHGAWSTVLKGTTRSRTSMSSAIGLVTPPSSPTFSTPVIVAIKKPARSDAIKVLESEAKVLSYLMKSRDSAEYVIAFHGIVPGECSLIMAALPISLEDHIKSCSAQARRDLTTWNMSQPVIGSSRIWLSLTYDLISALFWLHEEAGVVHGDIKPGNFLLSPKIDIHRGRILLPAALHRLLI